MVLRSVNRAAKAKNATTKTKTARRQMTNFEKGMIIAFFHCYRSIKKVSQLVCRPWTTVKSFLVRACDRLSIDNLPRSGRPPLLNRQQQRAILRAAKSKRTMSRSDLRNKYALGVSLSTID